VTVDLTIQADDLSKSFKIYDKPRRRLLDWLHVPGGPRYEEFWALRDVSFALGAGECLGIIGPNGAGKSTLLKLLTGSLYPSSGRLFLRGRVLSLLELGTGFTPELTGRENVFQSARLLGFPVGYAARQIDEIEAFAELGDYFDRPVKLYSSGMFVRLAFALFSAMEPDVFLIDEALAIGDLRFAGKALARVRSMIASGTTLLFVSHDLQLINHLCSRAIWLHSGRVQMDGEPNAVTRAYQQFVVRAEVESSAVIDTPGAARSVGSSDDRARPEVYAGKGWYRLEAYQGHVFRWARQSAEMIVRPSGTEARVLLLDLEPGPSAGPVPVTLDIVPSGGNSTRMLLDGRRVVPVSVNPIGETPERMVIAVHGDGRATNGDDRELYLRLFAFGWADEARLQSIYELADWGAYSDDLDLDMESANLRRALARCRPAPGARARISNVTTARGGRPHVRFQPHGPFTVEVTIEATDDVSALVVGVQIRDPHDRMISGTRIDWCTSDMPRLEAGEVTTVRFETPDLPLGKGLYQLTVGCHEYPDSGHVFQWVDGAWRFEVVDDGSSSFVGQVDAGMRYAGCAGPSAERAALR
jgi:ABC-type polysaccharide/polyol phosphate transport system ATPase subunit